MAEELRLLDLELVIFHLLSICMKFGAETVVFDQRELDKIEPEAMNKVICYDMEYSLRKKLFRKTY